MNKIDCSVVRDLLPSYIEGLTSDESNLLIKTHLDGCDACTDALNEMTEGESVSNNTEKKEINYLKRIKAKNRNIILAVILSIILLGLAAFIFYGAYGASTQGYSIENIYLNNGELEADITLDFSSYGITRVNLTEKDGIATIDVRSTSPIFRKENTYSLRASVSDAVTRVEASNGQVLWEDDYNISKRVNDIYNARVKDVNDKSAFSALLLAVDLCDNLKCKDYSTAFLTDNKSYGIKIYDINSYDEMFSTISNEGYDQKIKYCAYLLLACVENLDFVTFEYVAPNGREKTYSVSVDEANEALYIKFTDEKGKYSIKSAVNNYASLELFSESVEAELEMQYEYKYQPYCEETSQETIEILSNTPIDKKYKAIMNYQISDLIGECENYVKWGEAYEKEYKVIYDALLEYAGSNPDLDNDTRSHLIKSITAVENYCEYNDKMSTLFYACEEITSGDGSARQYIIATKYFREARERTLKLAECAYLLGIDFEWVATEG